MSFVSSVHCMDGRIQEPMIRYMKGRYGAEYVDSITEPGPCKILAERSDEQLVGSILSRLEISVTHHGSQVIALSGHYDCAGNPVDRITQTDQVHKGIAYLRERFPNTELIGLWVNDRWEVEEI